jgi:hypothetical protein
MKTRRRTKRADQLKRRTSNTPQTTNLARLERLKKSPGRPVHSRSGHQPISLRFEVRRPPAKNGQDGSKETSSRFQAAYAVFRQRHPNSVPIAGRQLPPAKCSPLEYVEWAIWKARERWNDATWDNSFLGFYESLVKSESLKEVCQDRCKSHDAAYALLGLLLWDADRFERENRTRKHAHEPVEHNIGEEHTEEALGRKSEPDAKQLLKIEELVKGLTCDYILAVNEARTPATGQTRQHQKTLAEIIHGFLEAFAEGAAVRTPVYYDTPKQGTGRSEAGVTSRDMFCALVSHFVQEAFSGDDYIGQTISIMKDFAPGLLKVNHSDPKREATAFVQRLKASRKKAGTIKEFNALVTIYKTHRSFPSIMKTFQYE